ncbi:hypothetical protein [Leisingera sp. D0M16]|uniref:hypothetical protein n=1 Tax=Leisingera coralii TaxID=3351347 RepID=UPI003BA22579
MPGEVTETSQPELMRMQDRQILGLPASRPAAPKVSPRAFRDFLDSLIEALQRQSEENPILIDERLGNTASKYWFKGSIRPMPHYR